MKKLVNRPSNDGTIVKTLKAQKAQHEASKAEVSKDLSIVAQQWVKLLRNRPKQPVPDDVIKFIEKIGEENARVREERDNIDANSERWIDEVEAENKELKRQNPKAIDVESATALRFVWWFISMNWKCKRTHCRMGHRFSIPMRWFFKQKPISLDKDD